VNRIGREAPPPHASCFATDQLHHGDEAYDMTVDAHLQGLHSSEALFASIFPAAFPA